MAVGFADHVQKSARCQRDQIVPDTFRVRAVLTVG